MSYNNELNLSPFSGKMAGYPMPTIRWLKDEKEFSADGDRIKPFVQEDGTFGLIFETTMASDKGIYTAIAESEEGFARYAFANQNTNLGRT